MRIQRRSAFGWPATSAGPAPCRNGLVVHYDGSNRSLARKSHSACIAYWQWCRRFHMEKRGWQDIGYCVDEETEILTTDGWKTFRDIQPGDVALTLNHETGMSEWQPLEDVYIFPAKPREMIRMEGRGHSSLTTPEHRWPVERFYRRGGSDRNGQRRTEQGRERRWATTETIGYWDRIPIAAESADLPTEPKWSDALVETIAWFWTEGHIKPQARSRLPSTGVAIYQNEGRNAARIRGALRGLFGAPVNQFPRTGSRTDGIPRWREAVNTSNGRHLVEFHLSSDAGRVLLEHAPNRVVRHEFLRALTRAQLDLFIEVSLLADGNNSRTVTWRQMVQKSREMAERFQFAATLAGMATTLRQTAEGMWLVHLRETTNFAPRPAAARGATFSISREQYDGHVWCVRTPNSTWLARRAGSVYFTGNSYAACPHGYVMEGRGFGRQQAAQPGGNSTWTSVTFMSGSAEQPTAAQIGAFRDLRHWLRGQDLDDAITYHGRFISTTCPGAILRDLVTTGALIAGEIKEDSDMPEYVSVGVDTPQPLPPNEWVTVDFGKEFSDGEHHHWDKGGSSFVIGPGLYSVTANLRIHGLPPGTEIQARTIERKEDGTKTDNGPIAEYTATSGDTFLHYALPADTVGDGYRVRFQVIHYGTGAGKVIGGSAKAFVWPT
ncbi:Hint domain-containing protein [Actinomadura sp. LOL_016]|uniref:Hint domain-containing protein n=1 Tax=unclassified Actinomadura TaxID=2626254 RepID=UPI003A7FE6B9